MKVSELLHVFSEHYKKINGEIMAVLLEDNQGEVKMRCDNKKAITPYTEMLVKEFEIIHRFEDVYVYIRMTDKEEKDEQEGIRNNRDGAPHILPKRKHSAK